MTTRSRDRRQLRRLNVELSPEVGCTLEALRAELELPLVSVVEVALTELGHRRLSQEVMRDASAPTDPQ